MTYRQTVVSGILVVFAVVSALFYVSSNILVQKQFAQIEADEITTDSERADDALSYQVDQLSSKMTDWAEWDDTYVYVRDKNNAYVESNLQTNSLINLGVSHMLFFDEQNRLINGVGIGTDGVRTAVPSSLLKYMDSARLYANDTSTKHKGILDIDGRPLLFATHPVLKSTGEGPLRGTLVFTKYFGQENIADISKLTHLDLDYMPASAASTTLTPGELKSLDDNKLVINTPDSNTITSYKYVNDYLGSPILLSQTISSRDAFRSANRSVVIFLIVIVTLTVFAVVLAIYITNQLVARDKTIKLKDEFFSIASHELRTPLSAIRGNAMLMRDFYAAKNDQSFADMTSDIIDSSSRLIRLVNNFLDAARFENGQVPLAPTVVSLKDVSQIVADELRSLARDRGIYIKSSVADDVPLVYTDRDRVMQIVYNFVGNAAKFTEKGGITISAQPVENDLVKVYITDTGRGISEEGQQLLFSKFKQVEASDSKSGSGLGLYISKMLVENLGGECKLEQSEEGKGTTISFTLPKATAIQIASSKNRI